MQNFKLYNFKTKLGGEMCSCIRAIEICYDIYFIVLCPIPGLSALCVMVFEVCNDVFL